MTTSSLARLVQSRAKQYGPKTAIHAFRGEDRVEYSWIDLWQGAVRVATLLIQQGLPRERSVGIVAPFSTDALIAEVGVIAAAGVACPLEPTTDEAVLDGYLRETDPWLVLVAPEVEPVLRRAGERVGKAFQCLPLLRTDPGATAQPEVPDAVLARILETGPQTPALALPTGGTTRPIQRVDLTNHNLCATGAALAQALGAGEPDIWMALRPSARPFQRVAGCYAGLVACAEVAILDDSAGPVRPHADSALMERLWRVQPTVLVCLADELASLGTRALHEAGSMAGFEGILVRSVLRSGGAFQPMATSIASRILARLFARVGLPRARAMFGGRLRLVLVGMGPVEDQARRVFEALGIEVRGSYGVAEAAGLVTLGAGGNAGPSGNVGRPLEGVRLAIAEDGEVLVSGCNVMLSYRRVAPPDNPMFRGEWLRTQDSGRLHDDGSLILAGRMEPAGRPGE